jgi:SAM-dependent methyltransferase
MNRLDVPDGAFAGIVAFYSIIHIASDQVVETMREFKRVLRPGGILLLSFHIGDEVVHLDEWWGHEVSIDFTFFKSNEMVASIEAAGLNVDEIIERKPYAPEIEHQSRRAYIFATSAGDAENDTVG